MAIKSFTLDSNRKLVDAFASENAGEVNMSALPAMSGPELLLIYNANAGKPLAKWQNKAEGVERTGKLIASRWEEIKAERRDALAKKAAEAAEEPAAPVKAKLVKPTVPVDLVTESMEAGKKHREKKAKPEKLAPLDALTAALTTGQTQGEREGRTRAPRQERTGLVKHKGVVRGSRKCDLREWLDENPKAPVAEFIKQAEEAGIKATTARSWYSAFKAYDAELAEAALRQAKGEV